MAQTPVSSARPVPTTMPLLLMVTVWPGAAVPENIKRPVIGSKPGVAKATGSAAISSVWPTWMSIGADSPTTAPTLSTVWA